MRPDGGPAFPIYTPDMIVGDDAGPGMTLRDWFAGQALAGALASCGFAHRISGETPPALHFEGARMFASHAYQIADAMLKWRNNER